MNRQTAVEELIETPPRRRKPPPNPSFRRTVRLPLPLDNALRLLASQEGVTPESLIREAIRLLLVHRSQ